MWENDVDDTLPAQFMLSLVSLSADFNLSY